MRIFISGKPKGKGRPRFFKGHAVTPKDTRDYEELVAITYKAYRGKYYEDKAISVLIRAYIYVPKSFEKKKKLEIAKGQLKPTVKPDADNIAKIILDGLNGVAYKDDKQIIKLEVEKIYTFSAEREGVMVEIEEENNE